MATPIWGGGQYASGIRRGRTQEEAVPVGGTQCLQPAATQKFFHKKQFQFIKAEVFLPFFIGWSGYPPASRAIEKPLLCGGEGPCGGS